MSRLQQILPLALLAIIISNLVLQATAFNKFCSVLCTNQSCSSSAYGDCTECAQPWRLNTSSTSTNKCFLPADSLWTIVETSDDIGGSLNQTLGYGQNFCNSSVPGQFSYNYTGNIQPNTNITYNSIADIQNPYYQIRIIFWTILTDDWPDSGLIIVYLSNEDIKTTLVSQFTATQNVCSNTQKQRYFRVQITSLKNLTGSYIVRIQAKGNTSSIWGIKQLILLAKYCHSSCSSCFGSLSTQCYGCILTMFLSNATCDSQCLPTFGVNSSSNVCIQCDSKCLSCYDSPVNCSQCVSSGQNASFFIQSNNTCVSSCPAELYSNATDRKCYACTASLGYLLVNGTTCIYCPVANCTLCSESGSTYTCESCQSGFTLFKGGNACVECSVVDCTLCQQVNICKTCKDGYTLVNNTCVECIVDCTVCQQPRICKQCKVGFNLTNNTCVDCTGIGDCILCEQTNICTSCRVGYNLTKNSCIQCTAIVECILCQEPNKCKTCKAGYNLTDNSCIECTAVVDCVLCLQTNICQSCKTGFTLINNTCIQCNVVGCMRCQQVNLCVTCFSNYQLQLINSSSVCTQKPQQNSQQVSANENNNKNIIIITTTTVIGGLLILVLAGCLYKKYMLNKNLGASSIEQTQQNINNKNIKQTRMPHSVDLFLDSVQQENTNIIENKGNKTGINTGSIMLSINLSPKVQNSNKQASSLQTSTNSKLGYNIDLNLQQQSN